MGLTTGDAAGGRFGRREGPSIWSNRPKPYVGRAGGKTNLLQLGSAAAQLLLMKDLTNEAD